MWPSQGTSNTASAFQDWPGGMKENLTALLLTRLPRLVYTHWMRYPSNARTVSTPVMVAVCSVRVWTVYTAPGKAVVRTSPLSTVVSLCIHSGSFPLSLCLQMRVIWSEQCPWSSRETLKAAVSSVQRDTTLTLWSAVHVNVYVYSTYTYMYIHVHKPL